MTRSSNTEKALRLNAAFDMLAQGYTLPHAAQALTQKFGLSRRQAYRYLLDAQEINGPVLVPSPSIPITIKISEDVVIQLRTYAHTSGTTIGKIVAQAIINFLEQQGHG